MRGAQLRQPERLGVAERRRFHGAQSGFAGQTWRRRAGLTNLHVDHPVARDNVTQGCRSRVFGIPGVGRPHDIHDDEWIDGAALGGWPYQPLTARRLGLLRHDEILPVARVTRLSL